MSRNAIAFCLFGDSPIYCSGAVRNAVLAPQIYSGWQTVIWIGSNVPSDVVLSLERHGVEIRRTDINPMLARFLIADDTNFTRFIVRDTDSRLNERERSAVEQWCKSGLPFHMIRDHPHHSLPMHGGLWGGVTGRINMAELLKSWSGNKQPGHRDSIYGNDQTFLCRSVWPRIKHQCFQHDLCYPHIYRDAVPFPASFRDQRFVGEIFDENDSPNPYGWQQRINHLAVT